MTNLAELLKAPGASIESEDDFDAVNALVRDRGWSDGLPVVPPTARRVEEMLAYCDRPWDEPVAKIPPRWGEVTPLRLAANATLGRAIRLTLVNIGGAIPGLGDLSTFGAPSKYSYLAAENEDASPWEPLHVERGLPREASAVTVIGAECPHNVNDHESLTAEGILTTIAGTLIATGANDVYYHAQPLIVMGPEHAKTVADGGFSKADAKRFLHAHAHLPMRRFSKENIERRLRVTWKERLGAAGKHSAVIHTFGATQPVTRALKLRDGRYARSVGEFRRR